eukprot:1179019-Prorocentrum_minimum.AAC.1
MALLLPIGTSALGISAEYLHTTTNRNERYSPHSSRSRLPPRATACGAAAERLPCGGHFICSVK